MARYLKLKRYDMADHVDGRTQGFRMKIEVLEAEGLGKEIFVYQKFPTIDPNGLTVEGFVNVASPADMEEYAVNAIPDGGRPFYRLGVVDFIFRSRDLADLAWKGIKDDVDELIRTLNYMDTLVPGEEVTFGTPPSSSSSSSSS